MQTNNFSISLKWLFILTTASFFLSLFLPYIGEEAVYTISSYEMWYHHHYLYPTTYGLSYWRPPLFNWLIILFANLIGWQHMLAASRLVTALATIATSFLLIWLANCLFKKSNFGLFAALIYLTSDALFYHGWLAYSDPLFAFFVVSAISFLWVANLERCYGLVWLSVVFLIAAFMTKALTAYVFYIISFCFIIYYNGKIRAFILKPINFLPYLFSILFYFFWNISSHRITETGMWGDIFNKFQAINWRGYIQQIIVFPLEVFWHVSKKKLKIIIFWLVLAVLLKYVEIAIVYYYQLYYRGDYIQIAKQVIIQTKGFPIYSNDSVATGLSLTAEIDKLIYPSPPLRNTQFTKEKNYFVINDKIDLKLGRLYKDIKIGKQRTHLYLLCQGNACYFH
jgi:4-amino-4-deoxy-L-arabinose transferase-like glycosyltransferase